MRLSVFRPIAALWMLGALPIATLAAEDRIDRTVAAEPQGEVQISNVSGTIDVRGWPSLIVAIMFFGGLLTFMLGVALEYLGSLLLQAHGKPIFFTVDRTDDAAVAQFFDRSPQ